MTIGQKSKKQLTKKKADATDNPRNSGRWTEGRYKSFITSVLRGGFRRWPPKFDVLKAASTGKKVNADSGREATHYRCAECGGEFTQRNVQVDHKEPIGSCSTWDQFVERLFCEQPNLQVLCKACHKVKTKKEQKGKNNKNQSDH